MRGDATATPATKDGYDAEIVDSYELGLKGDFLDGQFRMNAAVFYTDYAGQQVTTQVPKVTPPPGVVSFVDNVGSSRIWGAELEAQAVLRSDFSANFSFGYINAKFNEFIVFDQPRQNVDVADLRRFQKTTKFTGGPSTGRPIMAGDGGLPRSFRSGHDLFEIPIPSSDQDGYESSIQRQGTRRRHWRSACTAATVRVGYRTGGLMSSRTSLSVGDRLSTGRAHARFWRIPVDRGGSKSAMVRADGAALCAIIRRRWCGTIAVICIHGLTRNSRDFEELAPLLAASGRRVLAVDVRGRGQSGRSADPMRYQLPVYARDMLALLDALGIARAHFIGTSMGGLITMMLAGRAAGGRRANLTMWAGNDRRGCAYRWRCRPPVTIDVGRCDRHFKRNSAVAFPTFGR